MLVLNKCKSASATWFELASTSGTHTHMLLNLIFCIWPFLPTTLNNLVRDNDFLCLVMVECIMKRYIVYQVN